MEKRSSSNLYFINAIRGNLVTKLCNVNSSGKPALIFKKLKDIYGTEDLTSTSKGFLHSDSEFRSAKVKIGPPCLPLVERRLRETDPAVNEAVFSGNDGDMGSDSDDYIFGKMTLNQLKQKCKTKKRKRANSIGLNPQQGHLKLELDEDDSDLKETLSSWKLKFPKAKKRCISNGSKSLKPAVSIKSKQGINSESSVQCPVDLPLLLHVKREAPESKFKGCLSLISCFDDSFTVNQNGELSVAQMTSDGNPETVECRSSELNLYGEEYQSCALNQMYYDHLETVEPLCMLLPSCEELQDVNNPEKRCQQFLDLPTSEFGREKHIEQPLEIISPRKGQSLDMNGCSGSCHLHELPGDSSSNPIVQVPDMVVDDSIIRKELYYGGDSLLIQDTLKENLTTSQQINTSGSPPNTSSSSWSPCPCSSTRDKFLSSEDGKTLEKQPLNRSIANRVNNNPNIGKHLDLLEDESFSDEEKQPPISGVIDAERDSSSWNQNCAFDETPSSSVLVQTPERLLSTRKVISPTSQERLCLAINSTESNDDMDCQDCRVNLCNVKQTENRFSCEGSDKQANVSKSPKRSVPVTRTKFISSPSQIQRRMKHERTSPPIGNLEGPPLSHSLPSVSTGCASVQVCSESAIAFSRRQMHDIESLAMKLLSELKSMKDIVEEKLLFESYRNVYFKNDADEVKNAIINAIKAEETARKWLSTMGRDCNRFCKIMSLTQKGTTAATSNNVAVQRERKRITFADEAGGRLCHVKFFENGMASLESNNVQQEDQTT